MARKSRGFFGTMRHGYDAWLTEKNTEYELRILESHTTLFERQMEAQLRMAMAVSRNQRFVLEHELSMKRLQLEIAQIDNQIQFAIAPPVPQQTLPASPSVGLERYVSNKDIEKMALTAVRRFGNLSREEFEEEWEDWTEELYDRFPSSTAGEIHHRAKEMILLLR